MVRWWLVYLRVSPDASECTLKKWLGEFYDAFQINWDYLSLNTILQHDQDKLLHIIIPSYVSNFNPDSMHYSYLIPVTLMFSRPLYALNPGKWIHISTSKLRSINLLIDNCRSTLKLQCYCTRHLTSQHLGSSFSSFWSSWWARGVGRV